jgi:hypothetical protein
MRCLVVFIEVVVPTGEVSNFLPEDFDAVLTFMNVDIQKKKRKL